MRWKEDENYGGGGEGEEETGDAVKKTKSNVHAATE